MNRIAAVALLIVWPCAAQTPAPPPPPGEPPASPAPPVKEPEAAPKPPPSLDELLGITPAKPASPAPAKPAVDPSKAELERKLTPREAADQFKRAVELMDETAQRLQAGKDTGLATQRIQEDILRRLDMVIHSAEQQQQQNQQRQQRQQKQQQDPNQSNQQQQQQGPRQEASSNPAPDTIQPPARRDGPLSPDLAARGAAWGALPERLREALLQGNADKYSALYQKWTEAYYKKLAEEGNR